MGYEQGAEPVPREQRGLAPQRTQQGVLGVLIRAGPEANVPRQLTLQEIDTSSGFDYSVGEPSPADSCESLAGPLLSFHIPGAVSRDVRTRPRKLGLAKPAARRAHQSSGSAVPRWASGGSAAAGCVFKFNRFA